MILLRGLLCVQGLKSDERRVDLLTKGVEEEGANEDEGKAEADEEGDDASDEERGACVLLQIQVQVASEDDTRGCSATRPPWGIKHARHRCKHRQQSCACTWSVHGKVRIEGESYAKEE